MHPQPDEQDCIRRARQGDQIALRDLYLAHVDAVYRFMFYRTSDEMVAEDLTAEVFASVMVSIQRYSDQGVPFRAWLFRIARARLADYWRKVERRERHLASGPVPIEAAQVDDVADVCFAYEPLQQALAYLTDAEHEVVLLRFAGGLQNEEIATVIGIRTNAVKSRMHRALKKLRMILERRETFGDEKVCP